MHCLSRIPPPPPPARIYFRERRGIKRTKISYPSKGDENGKDVANVELSERGKEFAFFSLGERLLDTLEFVKLNRRSRIYLSRASVNPPEFESPLTFPFRDLKISRRKSKFDEHRRSESLLSFLFLLLF